MGSFIEGVLRLVLLFGHLGDWGADEEGGSDVALGFGSASLPLVRCDYRACAQLGPRCTATQSSPLFVEGERANRMISVSSLVC